MIRGGLSCMNSRRADVFGKNPPGQVNCASKSFLCYHCLSFNLVNYTSFSRLLFQCIGCVCHRKITQFTCPWRPIPFVPVRLCVHGFERSKCEPVADETDIRPAETFAKYGKGSYGPNRFGPLELVQNIQRTSYII